MPTVSRSGTRSAGRRNWRVGDRPRSRPGPRSRPRPNPFTELAAALNTLIRFHQSHPDWFPPPCAGPGLQPSPPALSPEWADAIRQAYHPDLDEPGHPPDVSLSASDGENGLAEVRLAAGRMGCSGVTTEYPPN